MICANLRIQFVLIMHMHVWLRGYAALRVQFLCGESELYALWIHGHHEEVK